MPEGDGVRVLLPDARERVGGVAPLRPHLLHREPCLSAHAAACPECRQAVAGRVVLFGALANVESALAGAAAGSGAR